MSGEEAWRSKRDWCDSLNIFSMELYLACRLYFSSTNIWMYFSMIIASLTSFIIMPKPPKTELVITAHGGETCS